MSTRVPDFYWIRKSIIGFATVGVFVIAILSSIAAVAPMYGSLRKSASQNLVHATETTAQSVGEYLRRISSISQQIGSRTRARQLLDDFHKGVLPLEKYQTASLKMISDAHTGSKEVAGIARVNADGVPLIEVGTQIPKSVWPTQAVTSDALLINGPIELNGNLYVVVSSPIYNPGKERIGTDVVLYQTSSLTKFLSSESSFQHSEASFLIYNMNGERMLLSQTGGGDARTPRRSRIELYDDAVKEEEVPGRQKLVENIANNVRNDRQALDLPPFLFAHVPVEGSGWTILLRVDATEAYADLNRQIQTTIAAVLILTLCGALGIYFLVRPLAAAMQREIEAKTSDLKAELRERRRAEVSLRESQATLRTVIDAVPACIDAKDPTGRYVFMNAYQAELTGIDNDEAPGKSQADLAGEGHDTSLRAADEQVMRTRKPLYNHEAQSQSGGGESRYWLSNKVPITDEDGNIEMLVTVSLDITKRKEAEAEREALEQELRRSQKLESLGTLAGGVAHEINTPSQYVGDNIRFLQGAFEVMGSICDKAQDVSDAAKANGAQTPQLAALDEAVESADLEYYLAEIPTSLHQSLDGVERIREIVSAIRSFSHPDVKEKVSIDIHRAIETTITVACNQWKHVAELETDFDRVVPPLPCLPGEFNQVMLNLIVNAAHAIEEASMTGPGKIVVSTRADGDWTEIRVADNGTGIEPESIERIFDMFYTTKGPGKGTGQGLAICHTIVTKNHGGTISVESKLGQGTTFIVRLPHISAETELQAAG